MSDEISISIGDDYTDIGKFCDPVGIICEQYVPKPKGISPMDFSGIFDGLSTEDIASYFFLTNMRNDGYSDDEIYQNFLYAKNMGDNSPIEETVLETDGDLKKLFNMNEIFNNTGRKLYCLTLSGKEPVVLESERDSLKKDKNDDFSYSDTIGKKGKIIVSSKNKKGITIIGAYDCPKRGEPVFIREHGVLVFISMDDIDYYTDRYGSYIGVVEHFAFGKNITEVGLSTTIINLSKQTRYWQVREGRVYEISRVDDRERDKIIREKQLELTANLETKDLLVIRVQGEYDENRKQRRNYYDEIKWIERVRHTDEPLLTESGLFIFNNQAAAENFCREYGSDMWRYFKKVVEESVEEEHIERVQEIKRKFDETLERTSEESVEDKKVILKIATAIAGSAVLEILIHSLINHFFFKDKGNEEIIKMLKRCINVLTDRLGIETKGVSDKLIDLYFKSMYKFVCKTTKMKLKDIIKDTNSVYNKRLMTNLVEVMNVNKPINTYKRYNYLINSFKYMKRVKVSENVAKAIVTANGISLSLKDIIKIHKFDITDIEFMEKISRFCGFKSFESLKSFAFKVNYSRMMRSLAPVGLFGRIGSFFSGIKEGFTTVVAGVTSAIAGVFSSAPVIATSMVLLL